MDELEAIVARGSAQAAALHAGAEARIHEEGQIQRSPSLEQFLLAVMTPAGGGEEEKVANLLTLLQPYLRQQLTGTEEPACSASPTSFNPAAGR